VLQVLSAFIMNKNFCIIVTGATGVGKTDFSLHLGSHLPIEIVNADLGQFYTPLTIGTAKPDWKTEPIKHHLFDILSSPQSFTIMHYRTLLFEAMQSIWARNKIPVIVGGSTLYIESIFFEPVALPTNTFLKEEDDSIFTWEALHKVDPSRATAIHPHDTYRIKRALALWRSTGVKPSEQKPRYNPLAPFYCYIFTRERDDLYTRINNRVITMLEQGWVDEVAALSDEWQSFIAVKKFIGYPDIYAHLKNQHSFDDLIKIIAQKTRNYAKRQETYWRMLEKKIYNCLVKTPEYTRSMKSLITRANLTSCNLTVYSKQQAKLIDTINESRSV
jgi:tRNA dimethylallyltransferase